jgi:hypothetical protein
MQYNVFGSKHPSNVQGNEENSNRKPVSLCEFRGRSILVGLKKKEKQNPYPLTLILKTMQSEMHLFFFWPNNFMHQQNKGKSKFHQMYKEMKKIQTGNRSLINPFQLNAYQKASISQQSSIYC